MAKSKNNFYSTTWLVKPTNEGHNINFQYEFEGTQEEVITEMWRVKSGLADLFVTRKPTPKQWGDFGCMAEGTVDGVQISLTI